MWIRSTVPALLAIALALPAASATPAGVPFEDAEENLRRFESLVRDEASHARAVAQAQAIPDFPQRSGITASTFNRWVRIGSGIHDPFSTPGDDKHRSGRITSGKYAFDVEQGSTVLWVGASSGGLWKFRNLGIFGNWESVSSNLPESPSVGDFLVRSDDPAQILIGTGDPHRYVSGGLWRSTDAGDTWTRVNIEWAFSGGWTPRFFKLVADRTDPDHVLGATAGGILRSQNFGASTVSWPLTGSEVTDIVQDPGNPQRWLAAQRGAGILESTDGGASWALIDGGAGIPQPKDRIALAICDASPNFVYALVSGEFRCIDGTTRGDLCTPGPGACPSGSTCQSAYLAGALAGVYRSSDGGVTFQAIDQIDLISGTQAWHTTALAVDPDDCDRVVAGMAYAQVSSNATAPVASDVQWRRQPGTCDADGDGTPDVAQTTSCDLRAGHPDHTGFLFVPDAVDPGNSELVNTSDGGVYLYDYAANTVDGESNKLGLLISQTMNTAGTALAGAYSDSDQLLAAMQDNGLVHIDKTASQELRYLGGGDGGTTNISPVDPTQFQYSAGVGWVREYADDSGNTKTNVECGLGRPPLPTVMTNPTPAFAGNPLLFTHTLTQVLEKPRAPGCDWSPAIPAALPSNFEIEQVDMAHETGGRVFYVSGLDDGRVYVSDETVGPGWANRTPYAWLPDGSELEDSVVSAERSALQPGLIYYTTRRSRPSAALLSKDRGIAWRNVTGDLAAKLPDADYWELIANPADLSELFLVTNVGIFRTSNGRDASPTWYRYMRGLPNVAMVTEIEIQYDNSPTGRPVAHIGTYGWGFWERDILGSHGGYIPGTQGVLEGAPLLVSKLGANGDLEISWSESCSPGDTDYAVYEGELGDFQSHIPQRCSTGGQTSATVTPSPGNTYYLVASISVQDQTQGAPGVGSDGQDRPPGLQTCFPIEVGGCP